MEAVGYCPYCGEPISVWIDEGGGFRQRYVEDCAVCCRPIDVELTAGEEDGEPHLALHRDDD
ncbi:MAG TPA: CPXCG motif-containing cysteine-rich protein [Polyangiales bacterium]|nr:CPXCG motif-containing cysteine-rich protein [Polyangiales bacterium]